MLVPLGSGRNGNRKDSPHRFIHHEEAGNHSVKGGLPPNILALHGGDGDAADEPVDVMVGPRHIK